MNTDKPKRRFRISVRAMLVLVALVAFDLTYVTRGRMIERRCIDLVLANGGIVVSDLHTDQPARQLRTSMTHSMWGQKPAGQHVRCSRGPKSQWGRVLSSCCSLFTHEVREVYLPTSPAPELVRLLNRLESLEFLYIANSDVDHSSQFPGRYFKAHHVQTFTMGRRLEDIEEKDN